MKDVREALRSPDAEERRRATSALLRSEEPARHELLLGVLGDEDWRVRKEAVRIATRVAEPWGLVPELVQALTQNENVGLRNAALEVLERIGSSSAPALLSALPQVPRGARKFLIAALGFAGGAGVERLAELANDPDSNTAQAALEALTRIGGPRAEEVLRGHLTSGDPVQRMAALEGLDQLEATVQLAELRPLLEDRLVRRLALRSLGRCADPAVVGVLADALGEEGSTATPEVAIAFAHLLDRGDTVARAVEERAVTLDEVCRARLRDVAAIGRPEVRRGAVWLLLSARDPRILGPAAELAAEGGLPPRAADAVRRWGEGAVSGLLDARANLMPQASAIALTMAAELARPDSGPAVIDRLRRELRVALRSKETVVALAAAEALGDWGQGEDAAALVEVSVRVREDLAARAGRALEALAERDPEAVEAALDGLNLEGSVGAGLLPAVSAVSRDGGTDRLQAALNAADPRVRRAAVRSLSRLSGEVAAELAGFALADEDVDVQVAAVRVLEEANRVTARDLGRDRLRLALRASSEPVAAAAARALGALGDRRALGALRELVTGGPPGVAVAAMEALRVMDADSLDELLVEALGHSDPEVVKEALRALATRAGPRRAARLSLALEHSAWHVRRLAAALLGDLGARDVRAALERRLRDEGDPLVRAAVEEALRKLTAEGAG